MSKFRSTRWPKWLPGLIVLVSSLGYQAIAEATPPDRLAPALTAPDASFTDADLRRDEPSLVAWVSYEEERSVVVVYRDRREVVRLPFDDYLVRGVRWIEPGRSLWTSGILPVEGENHGEGEDRHYTLTPTGEAELRWRARGVEERFGGAHLASDGRHWIASRLGGERAVVTLGRLGDEEPLSTWTLDRASAGDGYDSSTSSAFLLGDRLENGLGILWRGQLWLAELGKEEMDRPPVPEGCRVQRVELVGEGTLWIHCYNGQGSDPSLVWARYRGPSIRRAAATSPDLVTPELGDPVFRDDGTVLDLDRRRGQVRILTPDATGDDYDSAGVADLPVQRAGNRFVISGELVMEDLGGEYAVWDLDRLADDHITRR